MFTIHPETVLREAASLMADELDSNPEYERALAELAARLLGLDDDNAAVMPVILRAMAGPFVRVDAVLDAMELLE